MPRSNNHDDLPSGDINLLPEDMRHVELAARGSAGAKEKPYQLRTPKAERKRSPLSWLPFFGKTHWEAGVEARTATKPATPKPSVVLREAPQKSTVPQATARPEEFDVRGGPVQVLPGVSKISRVRKNPFAKLFGRAPSAPHFARSTSVRSESASVEGVTHTRHYSLLGDASPPGTPEYPQERARVEPLTPMGETVGYGVREAATSPSATQEARKKSRVPSWLNVFHLIGLLFRGGSKYRRFSSTPVPRQGIPSTQVAAAEMVMQPTTPPKVSITPPLPPRRAPAAPSEHASAPRFSRSGLSPSRSEPEALRSRMAGPKAAIRPVLEKEGLLHAASMEKPHRKKPLALPRWLDIFYILGLLFGRHKRHGGSPLKMKAKLPHAAPQPPKPMPSAPPPVTPPIGQVPQPPRPAQPPLSPVVEDIVPSLLPEGMPAVPQSAMDVTPTIRPRPTDEIVPKTPPDTTSAAGAATPGTLVLQKSQEGVASGADARARGARGIIKRIQGLHFLTPHSRSPVNEEVPEASLVNLITGQFQTLRSWQTISRILIVAAVGAVGLAAVIYGGLELWKQRLLAESSALDAQIERFRNDLIVYTDVEAEMRTLTSYIDVIETLLAKHIYWTNFFALLEKYTLPDVYYDGLSATTNGTLSLTAHGGSFETVSKVIRLLNSPSAKEFVQSASITSAQKSEGEGGTEVNFSIDLTLNPNLFYYGPKAEN